MIIMYQYEYSTQVTSTAWTALFSSQNIFKKVEVLELTVG